MTVKIEDGATYTLIARPRPADGEAPIRWVGDDGRELELTDDEAAALR